MQNCTNSQLSQTQTRRAQENMFEALVVWAISTAAIFYLIINPSSMTNQSQNKVRQFILPSGLQKNYVGASIKKLKYMNRLCKKISLSILNSNLTEVHNILFYEFIVHNMNFLLYWYLFHFAQKMVVDNRLTTVTSPHPNIRIHRNDNDHCDFCNEHQSRQTFWEWTLGSDCVWGCLSAEYAWHVLYAQ